jgi:hypothetical protein
MAPYLVARSTGVGMRVHAEHREPIRMQKLAITRRRGDDGLFRGVAYSAGQQVPLRYPRPDRAAAVQAPYRMREPDVPKPNG